MSIEGNLHGYIMRSLDILKDAKLRIEEERDAEAHIFGTWENRIFTDLCNALLLLNEVEKLNEEEIVLLQDILKQEHGEEEDLGRLLSENQN